LVSGRNIYGRETQGGGNMVKDFDFRKPLDVAVLGCDICGIRKAEYTSRGGSKFCKRCADELGLIYGEGNKIKD